MRIYWLLLVWMPLSLCGQHRLEVEARGVLASEGLIQVALYREEGSFLKFDRVFRNANAPAEKGATKVVFTDLPAGPYAIAIFHDENSNDELDTNWLGIPREPLGFSRARMKTFGPPSFRDCVIDLQRDVTVEISLE
jgi:uncharacterized protein (DUF2141 family)